MLAGKQHGRGQEKLPADLPEAISRGDSRDQAARAVGVSGRSVGRAHTSVHDEVKAARVAQAVSDTNVRIDVAGYFIHLVAIHAAPSWLWPANSRTIRRSRRSKTRPPRRRRP